MTNRYAILLDNRNTSVLVQVVSRNYLDDGVGIWLGISLNETLKGAIWFYYNMTFVVKIVVYTWNCWIFHEINVD